MANQLVFSFLNTWWFLTFLFVLSVWTTIWKGIALWRSAGKKQKAWFVCLLIFNTLGILEILYIFVFSEKSDKDKREKF